MSKIMLWPDVHREDGHWLPAVPLAKSLIDAGHEVRAMGILDTESIVTPYQINFVPIFQEIYPLGHALRRLEEGPRLPEHILPLSRGELDFVFTGGDAPDVLVAGYFAAFEALMMHWKYGVQIVIFTTFLRHPELTPSQMVYQFLLSLPEAVAASLIEGSTLALDPASRPETIEEFIQPLEEASEMIPMVREFDFSDGRRGHQASVNYVEPMAKRVRMDGTPLPTPSTEYFHPLPASGKLLYGAAGSQVEVFEGNARLFFLTLIDMMKEPGMAGRHLVLSTGRKLFASLTKEFTETGVGGTKILPPNVSLAAWVPQQEILERAEAVFVHGGLATIKESIDAGVPMVVVPMINDQFDNALLVEENDLGAVVPLSRLTAANLRAAILNVTSGAWFARATAAMRETFQEAEARVPKRSVEIIEEAAAP